LFVLPVSKSPISQLNAPHVVRKMTSKIVDKFPHSLRLQQVTDGNERFSCQNVDTAWPTTIQSIVSSWRHLLHLRIINL